MAKILILEGRKVTPLDEARFTLEGKLQDYLESYPTLIPLNEIDENALDLLCIGREVGVVPGSMDLLFIDANGILTIIETKLAQNPEVRRAVIGQIVEYASYLYEWTVEDIYEAAAKYFVKGDKVPVEYKDCTLDEAMVKFVGADFVEEEFKSSIEHNLQKGNIRLIIAVNELVETLRKTVTFLNDNSNFNILLLIVKRFKESDSKSIFIPSIFGYKKPSNVSRTENRHLWTKDEFLQDIIDKQCDKETADGIRKLLKFAEENGKIKWGTGTLTGSFTFNETKTKLRLSLFTIYSNGSMTINAGWMVAWNRVKQKKDILDYFQVELNRITGINTLPEGAFYLMGVDKLPSQNVQSLTKNNSLEQFEQAILSLCEKIEVEV